MDAWNWWQMQYRKIFVSSWMEKAGYRFECILLEPCTFFAYEKNGKENCMACVDSLKKCITAIHVSDSVLVACILVNLT